ncbi:cytidine deaminase-like protein [Halteromyces radiatus]|uniref:cytidine deaminase-like protein n=1 Tax=Halteromyces radiatus TaxID=101107 RepID=UPI0022208120|nr:cytidine deaminase-like protein [Halteromyces radiatus]KAI8099818.1 cytidine deaminase-like protein [Halteromyces radiatus]
MFIGVIGAQCSGKHTVSNYFVEEHGFSFLYIKPRQSSQPSLYDNGIQFATLDEMQQYVTERWRDHFITCDIDTHGIWDLKKRPFFLLVSLNAPIFMRYQRSMERGDDIQDLETFIKNDDRTLFKISSMDEEINQGTPLQTLMTLSDVTITNAFKDICSLYTSLKQYDLLNMERLRPSWDTYFMHLSDLAARRSNCMKRRVGCILVKDSRVIATGYNGTPRGLRNCNEGGCQRCNEASPCGTGLDRCLCMHAEENALLEAGRGRVDFSNGIVLYCNTCPCLGCAIKIVQQGIKEVVYSKSYGMDEMTAKVFTEAKVKLRQHSPPSMKLEAELDTVGIDDRLIGQLGWV